MPLQRRIARSTGAFVGLLEIMRYTDTAGATDRMFDLCCLLECQFAPRIRDLKDSKLYFLERPGTYPVLEPLIGEAIDPAAIVAQ